MTPHPDAHQVEGEGRRPRFTACGKQVLDYGVHFADAMSEEGADRIVLALSLLASLTARPAA